jgi:hypothetical protein
MVTLANITHRDPDILSGSLVFVGILPLAGNRGQISLDATKCRAQSTSPSRTYDDS